MLDQQKQREVKNEDGENGQASTMKPSTPDCRILEFRIQCLQPSEVEHVDEGRVRQLVDKIETHPH